MADHRLPVGLAALLGEGVPSRLLAFVPHPDDEAYAFGGLIAALTGAGWQCRIVCASSGERGQRYDGGAAREDALRDAREKELAASCAILGAEPPVFWRLPDGGLAALASQSNRGAAEIDAFRPGVVVTLGADGAYGHPDHVALHRWVVDGWGRASWRCELVLAQFPRALFEPQWELCRGMMGEPPSPRAEDLGVDGPALSLDIGPYSGRKLAAIAAHRTQLPGGDPRALFPAGIVEALLGEEWYGESVVRPSRG